MTTTLCPDVRIVPEHVARNPVARAIAKAHLDHTVMSCYASRHECEAARNALQRALDELA